MNHDPERQVGVVDSARVDSDRKGRARLRFSRNAAGEELLQDVEDGIRTKISVGYRIHDHELIEGERGELDTVRIMDFEPLEISFVTVPADASVGVGRSLQRGNTMPIETNDDLEQEHTTRSQRRRENRTKREAREREQDIFEIGEAYDEQELAEDINLRNGTVEGLKKAILAKRENMTPLFQRGTQQYQTYNSSGQVRIQTEEEIGRTLGQHHSTAQQAPGNCRHSARTTERHGRTHTGPACGSADSCSVMTGRGAGVKTTAYAP